jgi:hypothetical protein
MMVHHKIIQTHPQRKAWHPNHPHLISILVLHELLVRYFYHNLEKDAPTYLPQTAKRGLPLMDKKRAIDDGPKIGDAPKSMPGCDPHPTIKFPHIQSGYLPVPK